MLPLALVERGDAAAKGDEGVAAGSLDRFEGMPMARNGVSANTCCTLGLGFRNAPMGIVEAKRGQQGGSDAIETRQVQDTKEDGRSPEVGVCV